MNRIRHERQEAIETAINQNVNRAIALQQYAARTLEAADIATLHIAERYADPASKLHGGRANHPMLISDPIAANKSFLGVSIVDERGDLVASTLGPRAAFQHVSNHEAFATHRGGDTGRMFVSKPAFSRILGRDVIWLTRRINRADGSFAGVVAINIAPEQFAAIYEDVSVQPTDVMSVIGLDGVTRARRTGSKVSSGENLSGKLVMRMQERNPNGSYLGPGALDGLVRYFSHRRLAGYPLFATYGVLQESVLEPVETRARFLFLVATLVTFITLAFAFGLIRLLDRRDRQAAEVVEANKRLEEAQRIGQIGDWEHDLLTGKIRWSPEMFRMYGRNLGQGQPTFAEFEACLDEESKAVAADSITRAIETGEPQTYELVVRLPGGNQSHRLVSAIPTNDAEGKVTRLHGIDQDVSARKKLDRLEAEVAHLSRLEAMNAMAATLAHELNQPLAAASNYLAGSHRALRLSDSKIAAEGVREAQRQVRFAGDIIRRVRSMVAKERKLISSVSVSRIIDDALSLALAGDTVPVKVTKVVAPNASLITADHVQIQQVLLNLIRNARDATENVDDPEIVISSSRENDSHVLISVEDNGVGFEEDGAGLFSPFSSGSASGLGLGLSISRTIVESHGGQIWAGNKGQAGARVSFTVSAGSA